MIEVKQLKKNYIFTIDWCFQFENYTELRVYTIKWVYWNFHMFLAFFLKLHPDSSQANCKNNSNNS